MPEAFLDDYKKYAQSDNLHSLLEGFERLQIHQAETMDNTTEYTENSTDLTVRYWKLKKRPKPRYQPRSHFGEDDDSQVTDDDYGFHDEGSENDDQDGATRWTENELAMKRLELEERVRMSVPVEQRYREQISSAERALRKR